jgi:hypothetical protein
VNNDTGVAVGVARGRTEGIAVERVERRRRELRVLMAFMVSALLFVLGSGWLGGLREKLKVGVKKRRYRCCSVFSMT